MTLLSGYITLKMQLLMPASHLALKYKQTRKHSLPYPLAYPLPFPSTSIPCLQR